MKNKVALILCLLVAFSGLVVPVQAHEPVYVKATYPINYPPFGWEEGEYTHTYHGIAPKILHHLFGEEGDKGKYSYILYEMTDPLPLEDTDDALLNGSDIQLVVGYPFRSLLKKQVSYAYPAFMTNPVFLLFRKGEVKTSEQIEKADLKGGIIAADNFFLDELDQEFDYLTLEEYSDFEKLYQDLIDGKIDYILTGYYTGRSQIMRFALDKKVEFSKSPLLFQNLFFVLYLHLKDGQIFKDMLVNFSKEIQTDSSIMKEIVNQSLEEYAAKFKDNPPMLSIKEKELLKK